MLRDLLRLHRSRPRRPGSRLRLEELESRLAPANIDVLTFHNDNFRTGANTQETALTPANVYASQ
jgi:hypothetical protein